MSVIRTVWRMLRGVALAVFLAALITAVLVLSCLAQLFSRGGTTWRPAKFPGRL